MGSLFTPTSANARSLTSGTIPPLSSSCTQAGSTKAPFGWPGAPPTPRRSPFSVTIASGETARSHASPEALRSSSPMVAMLGASPGKSSNVRRRSPLSRKRRVPSSLRSTCAGVAVRLVNQSSAGGCSRASGRTSRAMTPAIWRPRRSGTTMDPVYAGARGERLPSGARPGGLHLFGHSQGRPAYLPLSAARSLEHAGQGKKNPRF